MNNEFLPQKMLAVFLKQPENIISCHELSGGSEEGTIFKCTVQDKDYVVKFFSNIEQGKNEIAWTAHAATLGIGPKFYYADSAYHYMITAFARGSSLTPAAINTSIIKNIAVSIARLHHSSLSFGCSSNMFERITTKYKKLHCAGVLQDLLEQGIRQVKTIEKEFKHYTVTLVPCHNDLNWGNIFIQNNHVTLIDWGDAAVADPYFDIMAFLVLNVISPENEQLFLQHYDAQLLEPEWQAYLKRCQQLVYFEFALNLLLGVQARGKELLYSIRLPQVEEVNHYLTLLAKQRKVTVDSAFLYHMAVAALNEMRKKSQN